MKNERVTVITGATGAIGGAAAKALAKQGGTIVLVARSVEKGEAIAQALRGDAAIEVVQGDLGDFGSLYTAASEIAARHPRIDALVHVAATYQKRAGEGVGGIEPMFAINHLGPFVLTSALLPALRKGKARVITVSAPSTSKLDFDRLHASDGVGALSAFGRSKMANLLFAFGLARREADIESFAFHPGLVRSSLLSDSPVLAWIAARFSSSPDDAGEALAELAIDAKWSGKSGAFVHLRKLIEPAKYARDAGVQDRLWETSEQLTATLVRKAA
jgi:NAD(P)-dependent dehydrogenase (short-subunit alcohol dehydrogenase family)